MPTLAFTLVLIVRIFVLIFIVVVVIVVVTAADRHRCREAWKCYHLHVY